MGGCGASRGIGVSNGAKMRAQSVPPSLNLTRLSVPSGTGWGAPRAPLTLDCPAARTRLQRRFGVSASFAECSSRARDPPTRACSRYCIASPEGNGMMKRRVVVLLVTLAALVAAAPSALAAPPTHERVPVDDEFVDESCGFPVEIQLTGFVHRITWVNEDGSVRRIEAFPQGKATLTNPDTGESITHNAAGPAHVTENPDGSFTLVGTGNWGWPNHPQTGEPGIFQLSGRFVLSVDAEGNESFRFVGRFVDLCAELAA